MIGFVGLECPRCNCTHGLFGHHTTTTPPPDIFLSPLVFHFAEHTGSVRYATGNEMFLHDLILGYVIFAYSGLGIVHLSFYG